MSGIVVVVLLIAAVLFLTEVVLGPAPHSGLEYEEDWSPPLQEPAKMSHCQFFGQFLPGQDLGDALCLLALAGVCRVAARLRAGGCSHGPKSQPSGRR